MEIRFLVEDPNDFIQNHWARGKFFESGELEVLSKYISPDMSMIDIGANVGNHSIYFDKFFKPKVVYAIEPIPISYKVMLMNSALNHCHSINFDYIGVALSDKEGQCEIASIEQNNYGATVLKESLDGKIKSVTGDSLFSDKKIDFIKIDVEGMEIKVLEGLKETIRKNKPLIFIEVNRSNTEAFMKWIERENYFDYDIDIGRLPHYWNYLIKSN